MKKITKTLVYFAFYYVVSGCTNVTTQQDYHHGVTQWDFDHNVQFTIKKIAQTSYLLELVPNQKVSFERLAVFLLRKSYSLCAGYHYKLEMLKGIEGFNDKQAMPNYIFPSLTAKVEC